MLVHPDDEEGRKAVMGVQKGNGTPRRARHRATVIMEELQERFRVQLELKVLGKLPPLPNVVQRKRAVEWLLSSKGKDKRLALDQQLVRATKRARVSTRTSARPSGRTY